MTQKKKKKIKTKRCSKCNRVKQEVAFNKDRMVCKRCNKLANAIHRETAHIRRAQTLEKECSTCKTVKKVREFAKDNGTLTGYKSKCKECAKGDITASKRNMLKYIHERSDFRCQICGGRHHPNALTFHHKYPKKKTKGLTVNAWSNIYLEETKREADECYVLCHNCHSLEHIALRHNTSLVNFKRFDQVPSHYIHKEYKGDPFKNE